MASASHRMAGQMISLKLLCSSQARLGAVAGVIRRRPRRRARLRHAAGGSDGKRRVREESVRAYEITGARDGDTTHASALITIDDGDRVHIDLNVTYNPPRARIGSLATRRESHRRWHRARGIDQVPGRAGSDAERGRKIRAGEFRHPAHARRAARAGDRASVPLALSGRNTTAARGVTARERPCS